MNKQKIKHDITSCKFCDSLDVKWKIVIDMTSQEVSYTCCDFCVDFIPYLDILAINRVWDVIKIEPIFKTTETSFLSKDYFTFMRQRLSKKILERTK